MHFSRLKRYKLFWISSILILLLDQLSKKWIVSHIPFNTWNFNDPNIITVIPNFFHIVHIGNEGAAWGMFHGFGFWLGIFAIASLTLIFFFRHHLSLSKPVPQLAFGVMIGGIIGNLIDRMFVGHVVDFLDFLLPLIGRFPAFNIADIGICVGVFLYIVYSYIADEKEKKEKAALKENQEKSNLTAES